MDTNIQAYCLSAVAYLKVDGPDDGGPVLKLSQEASPVLKSLGHGLLVSYLVDEGECLYREARCRYLGTGMMIDISFG